jgi:hypothetical protein
MNRDLPMLSKADEVREAEIGFVQALLCIEARFNDNADMKRQLADRMRQLCSSRSPQQVNAMEITRGLV